MGVFDEVKGKAKELAGDATGNTSLEQEGEAQGTKGAEERKATEARAEAQAHEKKAQALDAEQQAAQRSA